MKRNPFFLPHPDGEEAGRKADRALGTLFVILSAVLLLAKAATFGF